ncbi:MAG TPA: hypothetical protein VLI54_05980 [Bacillota bacterium]|nr:hypothetical protein [Bacillota bacterium]
MAVVLSMGMVTSYFGGKAHAATNGTINFQARLMTGAGSIVPDNFYNVEFKLYDQLSSSGSSQGSCAGDTHCKWTEDYLVSGAGVRVANGYLTVSLGTNTAFPSTINWDQQLWLTMNIGGTAASPSWDGEMSPRLQLTSVPYAFRAGTLGGGGSTNSTILDAGTPSGTNVLHLPAESGTLCVQTSSTCGFLTGTANSYIQNQDASAQTSANFWIDGTGTAATLQAAAVVVTSTATTSNATDITANSLTSGFALDVTTASTVTTGGGLRVRGSGATAYSAGAGLVQVLNNGAYTGTLATISSSGTTTGNLLDLSLSAASQTTATALNITQSNTTTGYTGNLVNLTGTSTTGAGNVLNITTANTTAGNGLNLTANGITTGVGANLQHTTSVLTTGALLKVSSTAVDAFTTGGLAVISSNQNFTTTANTAGLLNVSATASAAGTLVNIANSFATQTTSTALNVVQSGTTTGFTGNFVNFTGSSTTGTGNVVNITTVNTTAGNGLNLTANGITTGVGANLQHATAVLTTGALLKVSSTAVDAFTTGGLAVISSNQNFTTTANTAGLLNVSATATAAGTLVNIANSFATQTTSTALNVVQSGTTTGFTGNFVNFTGSSTTGTGNVVNITTVNTTAGNGLNLTANGITTGVGANLQHATSVLTTGALLKVSSTAVDAFTTGGLAVISSNQNFTTTANTAGLLNVSATASAAGTLVNIANSFATQTTSTALNVVQSGTTTGFTGNFVNFTGSSTTGTGNTVNISAVNTTAGNGLNVTANALTTGVGVNINSTGANLTSGSLLKVSSSTADVVATNGIISLNASGNYTSTSNAGLLNVAANATTAGTVVNIQATSLSTGTALNIATAASTGTAIRVASGLTTLTGATTGDALNVSNSTSTGNIAVFSDNSTAVVTVANGGAALFRNETNGASAFRVQSATGADTLLTVNTVTRASGTAGNVIKIGDSTGTDVDTTILQLDDAATVPATNLASLNGGLFYNSGLSKLTTIEGGTVRAVCTENTACAGYQTAGNYANTSLSNLTSVAINTSLGFQANQAANINFAAAAAAGGNDLNITGQTSGSTGNGGAIAIQGGASGGGAAVSGGNVTIQGGTANGTGASNGGNVIIQGGTAAAGGVKGLIQLNGGTYFTTGSFSSGSASATITQSVVDSNSAILVTATAGGSTFTLPTPTNGASQAGRVMYITNVGSNSFILSFASSNISLNPGSTATLIYSGSAWTGAGVDSSALQNAYNNSTGTTTPEIILDATRGGVDIQDANGGYVGSNAQLLAVRAGAGSGKGNPLLTVTNSGGNSGTPLVGIGVETATRPLHLSVNNSTTSGGPLLIEQLGAGDPSMEYKSTGGSFYTGVDTSDGGKFKISSSVAAGSINTMGRTTCVSCTTDSGDQNFQNASMFTMGGTAGTMSSISVFIVGGSSANSYAVALYADNAGVPGSLIAASASQSITPGALNTAPVTAGLSPGTNYWLAFNTNDPTADMRFTNTGTSCFISRTFALGFASPYGTCTGGVGVQNYNIYATYSLNTTTDTFGSNSLFTLSNIGQAQFQNYNNSSTAFQVLNTGGTSLLGIDTNTPTVNLGVTGATAQASTVNVATSTGATQTVNIGSTTAGSAANGTTVLVQGGNGASAVQLQALASGTISIGTNASNVITVGSTASTGTLTLGQSSSTNIINVGSADFTAANTQTINIGNGAQTIAGSTINVNILSGTAGNSGTASLKLANNDRVTQVDIGNVASDANRTLFAFSGNTPTGITDTINIGTGNTVGTGAKVIHIGDGTPAGTNTVTVGSIASTGNVTTIQGGNTSTGNGAVSIQAATSGVITVGTVNNNQVTLGGGTSVVKLGALGSSTTSAIAVCRDSSTGSLITCGSGTANGTPFLQGGNNFGTTAVLGTTDANSLQIVTGSSGPNVRATFDTSNNLYLGNGSAASAPNNFTVSGTAANTGNVIGGALTFISGAGSGTQAGGLTTIQGGGSGTGAAATGGNVLIQGGTANGTGASNGGNVTIQGGTLAASGAKGLIQLNGGTYFTTGTYSSGATSTITQATVDSFSAILATATNPGLTFTVPSPTNGASQAGRLLYVTNNGSNSFVLTAGSSLSLSPGATATLLWTGSAWTGAGADSATLQNDYTNSAGSSTPEITLDASRAAIDIQDINGGLGSSVPLLAVRAGVGTSGLGNALFTVTNSNGNTGNALVGINTNVATRTLDVSVNNSAVNALPVIVQQAGTGDAGIELKTASANNNFYVNVDASNGNAFTINSYTAATTTTTTGTFGQLAGTNPDTNGNYVQISNFTATMTGNINSMIVDFGTAGTTPTTPNTFTVAVYADNGSGTFPSGTPIGYSSLQSISAPNALGHNSNVIVTSPIPVTNGTTYWLAFNTSGNAQFASAGGLPAGSKCQYYAGITNGVWANVSAWGAPALNTSTCSFNIQATVTQTSSFTDSNTNALFVLGQSGQATFKNSSNSTAAFMIQNATTTNTALSADTTNNRVGIALNAGEISSFDLSLGGGANRTIGINQNPVSGSGANLTLQAGLANTTGAGGQLNLQGGTAAGTNQVGGAVAVTGGQGTGTQAGGAITVNGGIGGATGAGGAITITGGTGGATSGAGGNATLQGGTAKGATAGGTATLQGGTAAATAGSNGGAVVVASGNGSATGTGGTGGNITINAGNAGGSGNNNGGNIVAILGSSTGTGTQGSFQVQNALGASLLTVDPSNTAASLNLISNGGAETGSPPTGWAAQGTGSSVATGTSTDAASGSQSAKVTFGTSTNAGVKINFATAPTASTTVNYIVSFSAKQVSGTAMASTLQVVYSPDNGTTLTATCSNYSTQALSTTAWTKITCTFIPGSTTVTTALLIVRQTDAPGVSRVIDIDNMSVVQQNSTGTSDVGNLRVGGAISQGLTLLTLDSYAAIPFTGSNAALAGSMYFDTSQAKIQCYDGTTWGACGAAPNSIITLTPEYTGAVLNGTGIGTLTSDFCANSAALTVGSLCGSNDARNFYKWTTPQSTQQIYSMYVTYKLPTTFKNFVSDSTVTLTARTDNTTNGIVTYEMFKSTGSAITACGTATDVTTSGGANVWSTVAINGNENSSCAFAGGNNVIFKINVKSQSNANVYVENLNFSYTNQ